MGLGGDEFDRARNVRQASDQEVPLPLYGIVMVGIMMALAWLSGTTAPDIDQHSL